MQLRSIKQAAAKSLQDSSANPIMLTLLFLLLLNAPILLYQVIDAVIYSTLDTTSTGIGEVNRFAAYMSLTSVLSIAIGLFTGIWQCCYQNFTLNISRGKDVSFRDFTAPLRIAGKVFWLNFRIAIYTALWAIAFLFPISFTAAIIAPNATIEMMENPDLQLIITPIFMIPGYLMAYRYRLAFLILFDHEEMRPAEAIACSKRLIYGYKMSFFKLDLSFWWYYIPVAIFSVALPEFLLAKLGTDFSTVSYLLAATGPVFLEIAFCAVFQPRVKTADAHAYNCILQNAPTMPPPPANDFPVFPPPPNGQDHSEPPVYPEHTGLQEDTKDDGWHTYE